MSVEVSDVLQLSLTVRHLSTRLELARSGSAASIMSSTLAKNQPALINHMDDALDRIMVVASSSNELEFIPSPEWKGSRPGYYFGTTKENGTGYHSDHYARHSNQLQPTRKRARIDTSKNQIKILSADELLKDAESAIDPHSKIIDLTTKGVKQACLSLQKALAKNSLQRAQYPDAPEEYMESELALHEQIQSLSAIASTPTLFATLIEENILQDFCILLSHENTDIATTVIKILDEWLDPTLDGVNDLVEKVANDCLDLVVANLGRLNIKEDEDKEGMEYIFTLLENLIEFNVGDVAQTNLVPWLFQHLSEHRPTEVLALVFQQGSVHSIYPDLSQLPTFTSALMEGGETKAPSTIDGLELILQTIAKYRKKQPESEDQVEYLENICTILASALAFSPKNVNKFLEGQGLELVLRCIREKVHSGGVVLQLLDVRNKASCEHLVVAGGLKTLFPIFMGKSIPKPAPCSDAGQGLKRARKEWLLRLEQNLIHIIYNWTRFLDQNSPDNALERLLVKFIENDFEKCDHLIELLLQYDQQTRMAEFDFFRSDVEENLSKEEVEMAVIEAKLSGGGDFFNRLGAIAAFCCVHSKRCHAHILGQLTLQKSGIGILKTALSDFISVLEDGDQKVQLKQYHDKI